MLVFRMGMGCKPNGSITSGWHSQPTKAHTFERRAPCRNASHERALPPTCANPACKATRSSSSATTTCGGPAPQAASAQRLTAGLSEPATPCLSPDGRWIAYIGRDEQHPEVHVMPAEGGPARRLTWLGPETLVRGWTPQGQILFVSTHGQPSSATTRPSPSTWTAACPGR